MSKKNKSKLIINIEFFSFLFIRFILKAIPLKLAYILAKLIAQLAFLLDKRHRTRTIEHILHAGVRETNKEAKKLAKRSYLHLSQVLVESFKINSVITSDNIDEYISLKASEKVKKLFFDKENQRNIIAVSAHFGNWEFSGIAYSILSDTPITSIMRPFDNPKIGNFFYDERTRYKHKICPKDGAIKPMLSAIRAKESIGIISDQHANSIDGVETIFFNHPARTHSSVAALHLKTKIPIVVCVLKRIDDYLHFELCCSKPINYVATGDKSLDIQKITQLYTTELEKIIGETPEQWMWTHRRWLDINRSSKKKRENN